MTYQIMSNSRCKLKCKERGSKACNLLLFMHVMKIQVLTGHVTMRRAFVVVLTKYMIDLTIL
jgi:hypothetical protein